MPTIRASHLVIAGLALAGVGIVTFSQLDTAREDASHVVSEDQHSSDDARLARIEAALSALSASRSSDNDNSSARKLEPAQDRSRANTSPSEAAARTQERVSPEAAFEEAERQEREVIALLDSTVMAEKVDPRWSIAAAEEINTGLPAETMENTQVSDVRCQSSLCRIQATHANPNAEQQFMMSLGQLTSFRNGEAFLLRTPREDGRMATTIFVSRAGQSLPKLQ